MAQAVIDGEADEAAEMPRQYPAEGLPAADIIDKGFAIGIEEVSEFFLPELVQDADAVMSAVAVFQPEFHKTKGGRQPLGVAVAGTVAADIHEIGRTIACSMLSAAAFTVIDVGGDVPVEAFIEKVKEVQPALLLLSALLTTTMPNRQHSLLLRKITHAMRRGEHELLLRGVVELDESLVGGRERGSGKRGRATHLQSWLDEFC